MKASNLSDLPNIGTVLSERLIEVGIETIEQLKMVGSENAFIRLLTVDKNSCINELLALEGAIQGIRWHNLDRIKKEELKIIYKMCKVHSKK
jgi:DNA transformation protein